MEVTKTAHKTLPGNLGVWGGGGLVGLWGFVWIDLVANVPRLFYLQRFFKDRSLPIFISSYFMLPDILFSFLRISCSLTSRFGVRLYLDIGNNLDRCEWAIRYVQTPFWKFCSGHNCITTRKKKSHLLYWICLETLIAPSSVIIPNDEWVLVSPKSYLI